MASLQTAVCGETAANRCAGYSGAHAVPLGISAAPWEFWVFWELWEFWVFYGCEWYAPLGASGGFLWQGIGVRVSNPAGHPIAPNALKAPKKPVIMPKSPACRTPSPISSFISHHSSLASASASASARRRYSAASNSATIVTVSPSVTSTPRGYMFVHLVIVKGNFFGVGSSQKTNLVHL